MSQKEKDMFVALGLGYMVEYYETSSTIVGSDPTVIYRMAVEMAFMENLTGPAVDSLRRCYVALKGQKVRRETPEWDAMIQL